MCELNCCKEVICKYVNMCDVDNCQDEICITCEICGYNVCQKCYNYEVKFYYHLKDVGEICEECKELK